MVRPCGMEVLTSEALNMSRSPHLIIGYLLKDECRRIEIKVSQMVGNDKWSRVDLRCVWHV